MTMQLAGPAFPFKNSVKGVLGDKTRRESIKTSIQIILSTPKNTVVYNPELGSYIPLLIFDPLDDATMNLILYYAIHDLEDQEPRIKVTSVSIAREDGEHKVTIWIGYQDRNDVNEKQEQAPIDFVRG